MRIRDWSSDVCSSDQERPVSSNTALVCADSFVKIAKLLRHMDGALGGLLSAFELVDNSFYRVNTGEGRHPAPLAPDKPYYVMIEALGSDEERDREMFEKVLADAAEKGLFDDAILARSEKDRAAIWSIREDLEHIVKNFRAEERRVGKECVRTCRSRGSAYH